MHIERPIVMQSTFSPIDILFNVVGLPVFLVHYLFNFFLVKEYLGLKF